MSLITAARRRSAAALAAAAVVAASGLLVAAPTVAHAAPDDTARTVTDGTAHWNFKDSWYGYITGFAGGSVDPAVGDDGRSAYGPAEGTFDPETGALEVTYAGSAHYTGHGDVLDVTFSNLHISVDADQQGTVQADVSGNEGSVPAPGTYELATFDLSDAASADFADGTLTVVDVPTVLSEDAGNASTFFAQYAGAGGSLLSFSLTAPPPVVWEPALQVSRISDLDPAGETITVQGSGFDPDAHLGTRPPLAGQPSGVYVVVGTFAPVWEPSEGAPSSARKVIDQRWAAPHEPAALLGNEQYVPLNDDGSFTAQLTASTIDDGPADGVYGVYTYPASGAVDPDQELMVPITFADPPATSTVTQTAPTQTTPTASTTTTASTSSDSTSTETTSPPTTTSSPSTTTSTTTTATSTSETSTGTAERMLTDGTLRWGVKTSFRDYIISGPAHGEISTSGGVTVDGDRFAFGPATGTLTGTSLAVEVPGSVRFTGHDMGSGPLLDLTLSHLAISVTGTSGSLIADVRSRSMQTGEVTDLTAVRLATLDLAAHPMTVTGDAVTLRDVPAVLTEDGAVAFSGFYSAGDELDPVNFTGTLGADGTPSATDQPGSSTIDQPASSGSTVHPTGSSTPASTSTGAGTASLSAGTVAPGGGLDVGADGFQPGEPAEIHLHSDPVLLDTVTADASGAVRAGVTIPADSPAGRHTIVITGLESGFTASAPLTVAKVETPVESGPAAVTDGSLSWGVLAPFRSYISGSIANGAWQTSAGATESGGVFTFPVGSGSYDADSDALSASFDGAVRFTGHDMGDGPLLDLTISGLRVQASGDSGSLYADVRSRDMSNPSAWLQVSGVLLGELDLSGASLAPVDGRIDLRGIPVTLTAAGADGFAGFYQAGQQMDPLSLTLVVDDPGTAGSSDSSGGEPGLASTGVPTEGLVALAVALMIAGGLALLLVRRRTGTGRAH